MSIVNQELKARESCPVVVNQPLQMGESDFTGSSLYVSSKSKSDKGVKCVFCHNSHWSDKCRVVSDHEARKQVLRKEGRCFTCLKAGHQSKDCSKPCYHCEQNHHSAICNKGKKKFDFKNSKPTSETDSNDIRPSFTTTNYSSDFSTVLLPIVVSLIENPETM